MTLVTLLSSGARTTSGVSSGYQLPRNLKALAFFLNVTATATDSGDTLDVYIQESVDGGTTWNDVARFTQVVGTDSAKKYIIKINCEDTCERESGLVQDGAMSAGVYQGPVIPYIRVKYVITDTSQPPNASFTFSVMCHVIR